MIKSFNPVKNNATQEYMFFGNQPNLSRFDVQRFEIFKKLYEKQLGFFWKPEEIDLTKDQRDAKILAPHEAHIWTKTLSFQTFLDSANSRGPALALLPHVSLPELESLIELWTMFESLHSFSYSYIMQNVFPDPTAILDSIIEDAFIMERADAVSKYYDDCIRYSELFRALGEGNHTVNGESVVITLREMKRKLLLCVASINVLEGVRFYSSFACSFAFAERGLMEGNAKIISLIARDENLHLALTQNILKKWANGEDDPEMAELWAEEVETVTQMYRDCVEQEAGWAAYLFKDGAMLGLTEGILNEYVKHIAGKRMRAIGIKHDYPSKNPLNWTEKYLTGANTQVAPQEVEIMSYVVGRVSHDADTVEFADLSF